MKDFFRIFRVLYKNRYAVAKESNTGRRKLPQSTVMLLSMLPLVALVCVLLGFAAAQLTTRYSAMTLLNAILSAVQLFILFMMLPTVLGTLYSSEDNAFLASLPVSPTAVFFAKLALCYVAALKTAAVFLIPSLLTVSVTYAAFGNPMFYGFFPLIAVIVAAAPLLPLFIVVLFSMPVMWIGSFLKGRSIVRTVFSLLFYILLMAAYMVFIFFVNTEGLGQNGGETVSEGALEALALLSQVMYPNSTLLSMCMGIDAAENFGISLAIWTGLAAVTVVLAMLFYRRITAKQSESHPEESGAKRSYRRTKLVPALMKRDFLSVMRNPSMAMGTFSNIILAPIVMAVMFFFMRGDAEEASMSALAGEIMMQGIVLLYAIIFLCGTNMVAMTAYSREGESFFISKFLPIPPKSSVTAKLLFSVSAAAVSLVIMLVLAVALYGIDPGAAFALLTAALLFCAGTSALHIYFDIKKGNVHWKSQSDMRANAGGGMTALIPVLLSIAPAVLFVVMGIFMAALEDSIGRSGVLALYWSIVNVVAAAVAAAGLYILYDKGVPLYDKIGENRAPSVKKQRRSLFAAGGKDGFLK